MSTTDPFEMRPEDLKVISKLSGNNKCIDCGDNNTEWGSVSFGILFCAPCSGDHRGLGTHISRVRSVKMDSWEPAHIVRMKYGGNQQCRDFLETHGIDFDNSSIRQRYDCPAAELYKQVLSARIAGTPEPTQLPTTTNNTTNTKSVSKKMEGFGSSPPPPSSDGKWKTGVWRRIFCCFQCCLEPSECD